MFLFIDTISENATYLLFDDHRREVDRISLRLKGQESEQFFLSLEAFVLKNQCVFQELRGIVVVNGPGGFTSMRIITLVVNTIAFIYNVPLYPIDFFAFAQYAGAEFPMLLKANRGEYLLKELPTAATYIVPIDAMPAGQYSGIGDENDFVNRGISIQSDLDYTRFLQEYVFCVPRKKIDPIYIKKPNISIPTKSAKTPTE